MTPQQFLKEIQKKGFELSVEGNQLKCAGNQPIEEELIEQIKCFKPQLIQIIKKLAPKPYLNEQKSLVIPFDCNQKYHWWKPGSMKIQDIREELQKHWKN